MRAWHGRLSKSGLHANTVAKVYRLFRTMLDTAVDDGLLRTNPVHIKGAAVERSIERPMLDWDDIERIADAIHPRFRALVWVGATSGLRYGELTGLTRRHVDLQDRTLRVLARRERRRDSKPCPYYGYLMGIHRSAHKHGLTDDEIRHAWDNALGYFTVDADTEPPKGLCIGPDPAGNLLEILYLELDHIELVIHAMSLRPVFRAYLTGDDT